LATRQIGFVGRRIWHGNWHCCCCAYFKLSTPSIIHADLQHVFTEFRRIGIFCLYATELILGVFKYRLYNH